IPGSRLVVGGGASALRTRLQDLTDYGFPDIKYYEHHVLKLNAFNFSLMAAYSFGQRARTSAGISVDRLSGDGIFSSERRAKGDTFNDEHLDNSNARFARTRLTLGLVHRFSDSKKIGLYYRHGVSSSDQENQYQQTDEDRFHPPATYFQIGETNISTISSELGIRFRAQLTKRLFYGVEGSYLYERIHRRREMPNQPMADMRYLARRGSIGGGLGFFLTPKILIDFDVASGLFYNTEPGENVPGLLVGSFFGSFTSSPRNSRGQFLSAHAAVQTNLWRNLFLTGSSLTTLRRDFITYNYNDTVYGYRNVYGAQLSNAGIGWNFKPNLAAEYLYSIDHSYRIPSHSLKLRYTFNLGITGEK